MAEESCEYLIYHGAIAKGEPDISGIGVVSAFVVSAYLTFIAITGAYFGGLVDDSLLNEIDRRILHIRPFHPESKRSRIHKCICHVVVILSDQQIVTGIAIMSAGFGGLQSKEISVYHFQIVLYLAWMSSSVHLSAVTLLGSFLRQRRGILIWRFSGMIVLLVMLLIGLVPVISNDWGIFWWEGMLDDRTGWAIPAYCFWGELWGDGVGSDASLGFIILAVSYFWKMGALFETTSTAYHDYVRGPVERCLATALKYPAEKVVRNRSSRVWPWVFRLVLGVALPALALIEVASSFAASLWLSLTSLIYGSIQIFVPRAQMLPITGTSESSWGFGQLVPLILLVQPLGVVVEHLWSREEKDLETQNVPRSLGQSFDPTMVGSLEATKGCQEKSLLSVLQGLTDGNLPEISDRQSTFWRLVYSSKLFAGLVYLVQCAIAAICAVVFYFDVLTIGTARSNNWQLVLAAIAAFLGVGFSATLLISPFSIAGRVSSENSHGTVSRII
ncbi:hypothetical protein SCUP234_10125 [Seiridium cupressi]